MSTRRDIAAIQQRITNVLEPSAIGEKKIAGVVGEAPSRYSKSPALWNAAFTWAEIDAIYLPLDIDASCLGDLLSVLAESERFLGVNVTVPHKVSVMEYMDELDPGAKRIQAVNTIVRTPAGRLIGYNTDGEGFVQSILTPQPGQQESFMKSLRATEVLLLGAGGSARAVAFHIADLLDHGRLIICNRTVEYASSLAEEIRKNGHRVEAISENEISTRAPDVNLIINSSIKGQSGLRKLPDGTMTDMEPYSALAPADPPTFGEGDSKQQWLEAARAAIESNQAASLAIAKSIPPSVGFYDLIYHPNETLFLRHGRLTGHRTMNGKAMIIHQAALAFSRHICVSALRSKGIDPFESFGSILNVMYEAW
jgi:shikimate dehydrogenase